METRVILISGPSTRTDSSSLDHALRSLSDIGVRCVRRGVLDVDDVVANDRVDAAWHIVQLCYAAEPGSSLLFAVLEFRDGIQQASIGGAVSRAFGGAHYHLSSGALEGWNDEWAWLRSDAWHHPLAKALRERYDAWLTTAVFNNACMGSVLPHDHLKECTSSDVLERVSSSTWCTRPPSRGTSPSLRNRGARPTTEVRAAKDGARSGGDSAPRFLRVGALHPNASGAAVLPPMPSAHHFASAHIAASTFLGALSAVLATAGGAEVLRGIFRTATVPSDGKYAFYFRGGWRGQEDREDGTIWIDDSIPMNSTGAPLYTNSPTQHYWPMLLERATAMALGSYSGLCDCSPSDVVFLWCGWPPIPTRLIASPPNGPGSPTFPQNVQRARLSVSVASPLMMSRSSESFAGATFPSRRTSNNVDDVSMGAFWWRVRETMKNRQSAWVVRVSATSGRKRAEGFGLNPAVQYAITDVMDVSGGGTNTPPVGVESLVLQLTAPAVSTYRGPLTKSDPKWNYLIDVVGTSSSGPTFLMPVAAVLQCFSVVEECPLWGTSPHGWWEGAWVGARAGGDRLCASWRHNPTLEVRNDSEHNVETLVVISAAMGSASDGSGVSCGLTVVTQETRHRSLLLTHDTYTVVGKSAVTNIGRVAVVVSLPPGVSMIVPSASRAGFEAEFAIAIKAKKDDNDRALSCKAFAPFIDESRAAMCEVVLEYGLVTEVDIVVGCEATLQFLLSSLEAEGREGMGVEEAGGYDENDDCNSSVADIVSFHCAAMRLRSPYNKDVAKMSYATDFRELSLLASVKPGRYTLRMKLYRFSPPAAFRLSVLSADDVPFSLRPSQPPPLAAFEEREYVRRNGLIDEAEGERLWNMYKMSQDLSEEFIDQGLLRRSTEVLVVFPLANLEDLLRRCGRRNTVVIPEAAGRIAVEADQKRLRLFITSMNELQIRSYCTRVEVEQHEDCDRRMLKLMHQSLATSSRVITEEEQCRRDLFVSAGNVRSLVTHFAPLFRGETWQRRDIMRRWKSRLEQLGVQKAEERASLHSSGATPMKVPSRPAVDPNEHMRALLRRAEALHRHVLVVEEWEQRRLAFYAWRNVDGALLAARSVLGAQQREWFELEIRSRQAIEEQEESSYADILRELMLSVAKDDVDDASDGRGGPFGSGVENGPWSPNLSFHSFADVPPMTNRRSSLLSFESLTTCGSPTVAIDGLMTRRYRTLVAEAEDARRRHRRLAASVREPTLPPPNVNSVRRPRTSVSLPPPRP